MMQHYWTTSQAWYYVVVTYVCLSVMYYIISSLCSSNWIKTHGEEYNRGDYIITAKQMNDLPVFSKVVDLMIVADCAVAEAERFLTVGLENHLLSYQIKSTHHHFFIPLSTLKETHPFKAHTFDDGLPYITLRSNIEPSLLEAL